MRLISLRLCNFRQFYGETPEIILAGKSPENTTIIHGNNGSGKTTILNAFIWVLYNRFTAGFAEEQQLINKRAIVELPTGSFCEGWVEIAWEHDDKQYRAKRFCRAYKNHHEVSLINQDLVNLYIAEADGKWYISPQPLADVIGRILPINLHQYFFFDGERIEKIVRQDKRVEIAEATKILLGVEVLNRSIKHLGEAKKSLEIELQALGDSQLKELVKKQTDLSNELTTIDRRQTEIDISLQEQTKLKSINEQKLIELNIAKEIQQTHQTLSQQKLNYQNQLKQNKQQIKQIISRQGYTVFLPDLIDRFQQLVADLKESGELNIGISRDFLHQLISQRQCICGTPLIPNQPSYQQVQEWIARASILAVEESTIRLISQVETLHKESQDFWTEINDHQSQIKQIRQEINHIEIELDKIEDNWRSSAEIEVKTVQENLDKINQSIRDLTLEQGANQHRKQQIEKEINQLAKQINKEKVSVDRQSLAQRRIEHTDSAIAAITYLKNHQEQQFKLQLEEQIKIIFQQISVTPYLPKLTDKYELILVENTTGIEQIVAASTGENQILSLSFIAGIIDRVRQWSQKYLITAPDSSSFPIVMDSPFGSLDEISRRQISQILPQLANQLIILVSKTQWRGELAEEIQQYLGKQYVLTYYSSKEDCQEDYIQINSKSYPLVLRSPNQFDYTTIVTVDS